MHVQIRSAIESVWFRNKGMSPEDIAMGVNILLGCIVAYSAIALGEFTEKWVPVMNSCK